MPERALNVLFLCTGNSARSIIAESLLDGLGEGRFRGFSAGSHPAGEVHPLARRVLQDNGLPTAKLRSKNWEEFSRPDSPAMDFVFTVCDHAAAETCPLWLGRPPGAHWGIPDPAAVGGTDSARLAAFRTAYGELQERISMFMDLPFDVLDRGELEQRLDEIGRSRLDRQVTARSGGQA